MTSDATTRTDLTEAIHNEIGLSRYESSKFVEQVLELISSALIQNEQVKISKFVTFSTRKRERRIVRNPRSGASVVVMEKYHPYFRASKSLKMKVK